MKFENSKGFTLIELAVVLAILGMLSAALVMSGARGRRAAYVDRAAMQLESALKETQAFGKAGRAYPIGADPDTEDDVFDRGYGVHIREGLGEFYIYGGDGDGLQTTDNIYDVNNRVETVVFDGGVTVPTDGLYSNGDGSNPGYINIQFSRGEDRTYICINNCNNAPNLKDDITITVESDGHERSVHINKVVLIYSL